MAREDKELIALAETSGEALTRRGLQLALAESCTGGWVAKVLTDVAGSSAWLERGFVCYSNTAKAEMLGVRAQTLERYGAVSRQTVAEMAQGAVAHSHAHVGIGVTGIAGPGGGSAEKPVGLVWLGWCRDGRSPRTMECRYAGDRDAVRRQTVVEALRGLQRFLSAT